MRGDFEISTTASLAQRALGLRSAEHSNIRPAIGSHLSAYRRSFAPEEALSQPVTRGRRDENPLPSARLITDCPQKFAQSPAGTGVAKRSGSPFYQSARICFARCRLAGAEAASFVWRASARTACVRPYFNQLEASHPELAFYVVATRYTETVADIQKATADRRLRFPLYHNPDGAAARAYLAQQTPRVYLVDAGRTLLYRGAVDNFKYAHDPEYQPYLEPAIASFLSGRPIERPETASFGCAVVGLLRPAEDDPASPAHG